MSSLVEFVMAGSKMEEKNIYIETLEFGYKNISTGITVWELFKHLTQDGKFDIQIEGNEEEQKRKAEVVGNVSYQGEMGAVFIHMVHDWFQNNPLGEKIFLNTQAVQFYIELLKLRETREEAMKAGRHADRALYFAFAGLILGFIGAVTPFVLPFLISPPPQKVEIINKQFEPIHRITPFVSLTAQKGHSEPLSFTSDNTVFCSPSALILLDFFSTASPLPKISINSALQAVRFAPP